MRQNDGPVELPYHVLVGASTNGDRMPPTTLPKRSSTGLPSSTRIGSARGAGVPVRTQLSSFLRLALKAGQFGKRLRGPSLQSIGGTARPPFSMSADAPAKLSSSGVACA